KSDARQIGHVFQSGIGKIRSADLCTALEQMAAYGSLRKPVQVIRIPAVHVQQRPERQCRIRGTSDQHHVSTRRERISDASCAEVRVGGHDVTLTERNSFDDWFTTQFVLGHSSQQIVSSNSGYFDSLDAELLRERLHAACCTERICGTHVGYDANA